MNFTTLSTIMAKSLKTILKDKEKERATHRVAPTNTFNNKVVGADPRVCPDF